MDLSAIIVVVILTVFALGSIVWLQIHSGREQRNEGSPDQSSGTERAGGPSVGSREGRRSSA
jgi:hypothetical protein